MVMDVGKWLCEVVEHGFSKARTGSSQLFVVFKNEHDDEITWYSTMGVKRDGTISEKALEIMFSQLSNMGWDAAENGWDMTPLGEGECLIGNQAQLVVRDEVYQGVTRRKVKYINDPNRGGGERESVSGSDAYALMERIRQAAHTSGIASASRAASNGAQRSRAQPPTPRREKSAPSGEPWAGASSAGIDYDDIPL